MYIPDSARLPFVCRLGDLVVCEQIMVKCDKLLPSQGTVAFWVFLASYMYL